MIHVLFGLPGAGKSYVGQLLHREFGMGFYEGDLDLPQDMKTALQENRIITTAMRDRFFTNITNSMAKRAHRAAHLVIAQTFLKEHYRHAFKQTFPDSRFYLISATKHTRRQRLTTRNYMRLHCDYLQTMENLFEKPRIGHIKISNNHEGDAKLLLLLQNLFPKQ